MIDIKLLKSFFLLFLFFLIFGVIFFLIDNIQNQQISSEKFALNSENLKNGQIPPNSIVEITGTLDLSNIIETRSPSFKDPIYYYLPLLNYETNIIVRVNNSSLLKNELQNFSGKIVKINSLPYYQDLLNALNTNFSKSQLQKILDVNEISDEIYTKFNDEEIYEENTFVILDQDFSKTDFTLNILFFFVSFFLFLLFVFRQKLFNILKIISLKNN